MTRVERIGDATLYLGDCLEILPTLPKVDAVITDPPYGIGFKYESHEDDAEEYPQMMRSVVTAVQSICEGGMFWWQANQQASRWHEWFPPGFRLMASCKDFVQMRPTRIQFAFDPVIFWWNGEPPKWESAGSRTENAKQKRWDWHVAKSSSALNDPNTKTGHPCQRPVDAVRWVVNCATDAGQMVIDPFMGSGTTGVACANLGRKFIGIEIEPKYFDIACERIDNAYRQQRMFA